MDKKYFVSMDADKIQSYLFSTNKLKEIRGASSILNKLNSKKLIDKLVKLRRGELIYAGGGSIKAVFEEKGKAEDFVINITKLYKKVSVSATISGIIEETTESELNSKFNEVSIRSDRKLRHAKDAKNWTTQLITSPYFKFCNSCGRYPAEHKDRFKPENYLCQTCGAKRSKAEREILFKRFINWVEKRKGLKDKKQYKLCEDLSDLASYSSPENYVGLIYCDGNRMGEKFKDFNTKEEYKQFSKIVHEASHNSVFEALYTHIFQTIYSLRNNICPFEIVLIGGDDSVIIVPADKAIPVARDICRNFNVETGKSNSKYEVSMSAGVAIAHANYPIFRLYELASGLLKSAKKLSNDYWRKSLPENISALDFMVISTPLMAKLNDVRKEYESDVGRTPKYTLHNRPYKVGSTTVKSDIDTLIEAIQTLKQNSFPKNKLNGLYRSIFKAVRPISNPNQATYEALVLRSRLKEEDRRLLDSILGSYNSGVSFPWIQLNSNEFRTPITDVVELYEFIK